MPRHRAVVTYDDTWPACPGTPLSGQLLSIDSRNSQGIASTQCQWEEAHLLRNTKHSGQNVYWGAAPNAQHLAQPACFAQTAGQNDS